MTLFVCIGVCVSVCVLFVSKQVSNPITGILKEIFSVATN